MANEMLSPGYSSVLSIHVRTAALELHVDKFRARDFKSFTLFHDPSPQLALLSPLPVDHTLLSPNYVPFSKRPRTSGHPRKLLHNYFLLCSATRYALYLYEQSKLGNAVSLGLCNSIESVWFRGPRWCVRAV